MREGLGDGGAAHSEGTDGEGEMVGRGSWAGVGRTW